MKKVISVCLVYLLLFSCSGCNKNIRSNESSENTFAENTPAGITAASETEAAVTDGDSGVPADSQSQPDAVATDFLKKLYSVDTNDLSAMNKIEAFFDNPSSLNQDSVNQINTIYESLHEKFKSDMTDGAYKSMDPNRTYSSYLTLAQKNNYTLQSKIISLSKMSGSDTSVQYSYTATIEVTYLDNKEKKEITESGVVQETKESQWKINYIHVTKPSYSWYVPNSQS